MQGKRRLALCPSACEKPTPDLILWCLWNVLREEHCDTEVSSHRSHQDIIPTKTFGSGLPSQGTCETDQRSLCIIELIIFVCFPLQCIPKNERANQNAFGNASICVWAGFQEAFPLISPQSDWLSVVFYTLLRKGESLWPWPDLGHLVSFNLLSIPPAQYLSSPQKKDWVKFLSLTNCLIDFHLCWKLYPHIKECINQQNIPLTFHYKAIFILPLQL